MVYCRRLFSLVWVSLVAPAAFSQQATSIFYSRNQKDILEILVKALDIKVKERVPGQKRISFSVIPVAKGSTGGKQILVSSVSAAFVMGHEDSTNVSSIYFTPYTDLSDTYGFYTKANLWTPGNRWNLPSDFRIMNLTEYSYGLGSTTQPTDEFTLRYNYIRLYLNANRHVSRYLYLGMGLNYDRYWNVSVKDAPTNPSAFEKYGYGTTTNSNSTGITFNLLRDSRRNSINPDRGFYTLVTFRTNPSWMHNNELWSSVYVDARKYLLLDRTHRKILALWGFYWGTFGSVPYNNLPGTRLEYAFSSGRGYAQGRFRGREMIYFESEYRFDITHNGLLGGVVFANAQSLTEEDNQYHKVNPAIGFGARLKFNKESNTNITFDFGFGEKSFTFYLGLGELF